MTKKIILSPKEFDELIKEFNYPIGVKITLVSSKILDLKLEQELLIDKLDLEDNNDIQDLVSLAKYFLLIRHMQKVLNRLNKNFLEG